VKWNEGAGIHYTWELNMANLAKVNIEHVIALDARDLEHSKIATSIGTKLHEVRQALSALEQHATDSEVEETVECIECTGDEGICVVCQCDLERGETGSRLRACGHVYHPECIDSWLLNCKRECPICKTTLGVAAPPPEEKSRVVHARSTSVGTRVEIQGLQSKPQLNGQVGRVVQWMEAKGRYKVVIDGGEATTVLVKPANLLLVNKALEEAHLESPINNAVGASVAASEDVQHQEVQGMDEEDANLAAAIALSLASDE